MRCTKHGIEDCTDPKCIKEQIKKRQQEESIKKLSTGKDTY